MNSSADKGGMLPTTLLDPSVLSVDGTPASAMPRTPGLHDIETRLADGRSARFTLSLPAATSVGPPLVLVLHYAGQPTRFYGRPLLEQLFAPALATLDAVLVAPESLGGQWNESANEAWVIGLLDAVVDTYEVDRARIALGGYSMGALGTWHLAAHYPERFSALIPIAGIPAAAVDAMQPAYMLASPDDELFDFARFEDLAAQRRAAGHGVELARVAARGHYDVGGFRSALDAVAPWLAALWSRPS